MVFVLADDLGYADINSFEFLGHEKSNITDNSPLKGGKTTFYEGGIRVPMIIRWPEVIDPKTQRQQPVIGIDFYPKLLEAPGIGKPEGKTMYLCHKSGKDNSQNKPR